MVTHLVISELVGLTIFLILVSLSLWALVEVRGRDFWMWMSGLFWEWVWTSDESDIFPTFWFHMEIINRFYPDIVISLPTFIIAECVLIYLDPDSSQAIVGWASKAFSTAIFFLYEQVFLSFWNHTSFCSHFWWNFFHFEFMCILHISTGRCFCFKSWFGNLWLNLSTDSSRWCLWPANDQKFRGTTVFDSPWTIINLFCSLFLHFSFIFWRTSFCW